MRATAVTVDAAGAIAFPSRAINNEQAAPVLVTIGCFDWRLRRVMVTLPVDADLALRLRRQVKVQAALLTLWVLEIGVAITGLVSLAAGLERSAESALALVNIVFVVALLVACWRYFATRPAQWPQVTTPGRVLINGVDSDVAREWQAINPAGVIQVLEFAPR